MKVGDTVTPKYETDPFFRYEGIIVSMKHGIIHVKFSISEDEYSYTEEELEKI